MRMLDVLEPTSNGRIEIGYDFFDALPKVRRVLIRILSLNFFRLFERTLREPPSNWWGPETGSLHHIIDFKRLERI